jgi:hypothetical protein
MEDRLVDLMPDTSPDAEMVEGGCFGRWSVVGDNGRYTARSSCFTLRANVYLHCGLRRTGSLERRVLPNRTAQARREQM